MLIDHEELMKWAKAQAPLKVLSSPGNARYRRFIRLEITHQDWPLNDEEDRASGERVVARAYIREDCWVGTQGERAPLAERRLD
jgi:hypothetical protein